MASGEEYPVSTGSLDTPRAVAGLVIGSMLALWLIRRGFRGLSAGGVGISVK
jgi:hypothetical protein